VVFLLVQVSLFLFLCCYALARVLACLEHVAFSAAFLQDCRGSFAAPGSGCWVALEFVRGALAPDPHYGGLVPAPPRLLYATAEDPTVAGEHAWWAADADERWP
jgi:hypothetical protein